MGVAAACTALGIPRSSYYRLKAPRQLPAEQEPPPSQAAKRPPSKRALSAAERTRVLELLNSERFADMAPREIYATLLDVMFRLNEAQACRCAGSARNR